MNPYVNLTIEDGIGYIEFYHPDHNAMPSDILQKLEKTIEQAGNNEDVKVVVLKSGGNRTFCAGASFNELIAIRDKQSGAAFFSGFANVINAMRNCPKIIIGRVQGKAVGGGVGLAAATDYCLATKFAAIKLSELSIGIGPFVIEPTIKRKMGLTPFTKMTLEAEKFFSADFANENDLFADIFESVESLDHGVKSLARKLCGYNPKALLELKKILWQGTDHWDKLLLERAAISGELVLSNLTKKTLERYK